MYVPGAHKSGLIRPSVVGPREDPHAGYGAKSATCEALSARPSMFGSDSPLRSDSVAPTASTFFAEAGMFTDLSPRSLPAAITGRKHGELQT